MDGTANKAWVPRLGFRVRPIFAWYDLWIGAYWDRDNRRLYILPLPCLGVRIDVRPRAVAIVAHCPPGGLKIRAIKEIRAATGLGLREAKEATEGAGLTLAAEVGYPLATTLRDLGLTVEVQRSRIPT